MPNQFYQNKIVVITGGSSGIGLALAKALVVHNPQLVLIARDNDRLLTAKLLLENMGGRVSIVAADVSLKNSVTTAIDATARMYGGIDMLINCAGIITCGRFIDQPIEDLEKCFQINYMGSLYASKAAWPFLKATKGQLSFVSSVAGYMGLIGYSSYAPPKFALTGLAECLRMEGKDDGISISIIYPPDTDTALLHFEHKHTLPECRALSKNIKVKTPEQVALKYLKGLEKKQFEIYCDKESLLLRWFKNNFASIFNWMTNRMIEKERKKQVFHYIPGT